MTQQHNDRAHSSLGASAAHRWIPCPGSVRAQAGRPNPTNEHAARGTAAHELADKCLKNGYNADRFFGDTITVKGVDAGGAPVSFDFPVDERMVENVQLYLDNCRADVAPGDLWFIEQRFDLSHIWPGMFGTSDWAAYRVKTRHLIVSDYKNGFGLVDVADNPQAKFYGVGALHELQKLGHVVDKVTLRIVQPNAPHIEGVIREWTCDVLDLVDFIMELRAAAALTELPDAPRKAGDHCGYCLAAANCPALTSLHNQMAAVEFDPIPEIPVEKLAQLLDAAVVMEARISAAWSLAHTLAAQGVTIPGYKLVERTGRRKWAEDDEAAIITNLRTDYKLSDEDIFVKKLRSPAQIEKVIPKPRGQADAAKSMFNHKYTIRPNAGTTLARDVDPRSALSSSAAQDFVAIDNPNELFTGQTVEGEYSRQPAKLLF